MHKSDMHKSDHSLLSFSKRLMGGLAIGAILREEYLYEVHGPFVTVASAQLTPSFSKRLIDRLSASMRGLASAIRPHHNARRSSG